MSQQNTHAAKRQRSVERHARKHEASKRIGTAGYVTNKKTVLGQRYSRDHGLPHSSTWADVTLPGDLLPTAA